MLQIVSSILKVRPLATFLFAMQSDNKYSASHYIKDLSYKINKGKHQSYSQIKEGNGNATNHSLC